MIVVKKRNKGNGKERKKKLVCLYCFDEDEEVQEDKFHETSEVETNSFPKAIKECIACLEMN